MELTSCVAVSDIGLARVYSRYPIYILDYGSLSDEGPAESCMLGGHEAFCRLRYFAKPTAFERYFLFKGGRAIEMTGAQVQWSGGTRAGVQLTHTALIPIRSSDPPMFDDFRGLHSETQISRRWNAKAGASPHAIRLPLFGRNPEFERRIPQLDRFILVEASW